MLRNVLVVFIVMSAFLQVSAERLVPAKMVLQYPEGYALSVYTDTRPLRDCISLRQETVQIRHPGFGIKFMGGSRQTVPGMQSLTFHAAQLSKEPAELEVLFQMYAYHFSDDGCTGKAGDFSVKKQITVAAPEKIKIPVEITRQDLNCGFCDEKLPTLRYSVRILLVKGAASIKNINFFASSPSSIWGRKEMKSFTWLPDALRSDRAKDAARNAAKRKKSTPSDPKQPVRKSARPPSEVRPTAPEPDEIPVAMDKVIRSIEPEFPALFHGKIVNGELHLSGKPSNEPLDITLHLDLPEIPAGFEYVIVPDRQSRKWLWRIYDRNDRPYGIVFGYLKDGNPALALPPGCDRVVVRKYSRQEQQGVISKILYRKRK